MSSFKQIRSRDCGREGKPFSKKFDVFFWDQFFLKKHFFGKGANFPLFCSPCFWLSSHWKRFVIRLLSKKSQTFSYEICEIFKTNFFEERLRTAPLKTYFLNKKNCNIDYSSSLPYLIDVNWLYISCKVTRKKKSAVKK